MAQLEIGTGASFSLSRKNITLMLEELETRESIALVHMDKEMDFRFFNRDRLETALHALLTANTQTDDIIHFGEGASWRNCRKAVREMFTTLYSIDNA